MKKIITLTILLCCITYNLTAGSNTRNFEISTPPDLMVNNSRYNKFEFIDSRSFTDYLGFSQPTILHSRTYIIEKPSLEKQLNTVFKEIINGTAQKGTLVFQLRRLYFSNASKAYCHLRYSLI